MSGKNQPQNLQVYFLCSYSRFRSGCGGINFNLLPDRTKPLKERVLEGEGEERWRSSLLQGLFPISPEGSDRQGAQPGPGSGRPASIGRKRSASKSHSVESVLPGGTVTASDLLYHEIMAFKERKKIKIIVMMMNTAASGGYYVSLPADVIFAHPTTITGSIGVIFLRPTVSTLMDKLGVTVESTRPAKTRTWAHPTGWPVRKRRNSLAD